MAACTRTPGSVWTTCRCPVCAPEMSRQLKRHRAGIKAVEDVRDQAWARILRWVEAGYSARVVAGLTGMSIRASDTIVATARKGGTYRLEHANAHRIMAAPDRPTGGGGWVPSIGTARRLRALAAVGWSTGELSARSGIPASTLAALRDTGHRTTRPRFAIAVEALYDQLWDQQPTSSRAAHTVARAKAKGWPPPLAWDDDTIDDPATEPDLGDDDGRGVDEVAILRRLEGDQSVQLSRAERWAVVERLAAQGCSDAEIGRRLGVCDRTVLRDRQMLGIESRYVA